MTKRFTLLPIAALALGVLPFVALPANAVEKPDFGYDCEDCPTNWGNLSEAFKACFEGTKQTPIAFDRRSAKSADLRRLRVSYGESSLEVERLETNFEAFVEAGSNSIRLGGKSYTLAQFHFHSASEHVVDGERYPLEMHLVHAASDGALAVIGVFVKEGDNFDALDSLIDALPFVEGIPVESVVDVQPLDVGGLLPAGLGSYRYVGSTTTPPCTAGVQWILLDQAIEFSAEQIAEIQATIREFNHGFDNNRPIQERNGRVIETDVEQDDDDD